MKNDPLCRFFLELRNRIEKEGISGIETVQAHINHFNQATDIIDYPEGIAGTIINSNGIFFSIYPNTPKVDVIPAKTKADLTIVFRLNNVLDTHLGRNIQDKNFFEIVNLYYEYLKSLVEECTSIINTSK